MSNPYRILKILNNNSMILDADGIEKLYLGRGIAFGKKNNQYCQLPEKVDKVFVIEDQKNVSDFEQLVNRNDESFILFCEELIRDLSRTTKRELNERIHISLIDHLSCTLRRLKMGEPIINPFLQEIEVLYEKEILLAEKVCRAMEKRYQVEIPRGEVGFVAIHIHSAMYNGKIRDTLKGNRICNKVLALLEEEFHTAIDRKSFDCARFMVHLTYLAKRIRAGEPVENKLVDIIISSYPESYRLSEKVAAILEQEMKPAPVSREETAYLTVHIERLASMLRREEAERKGE